MPPSTDLKTVRLLRFYASMLRVPAVVQEALFSAEDQTGAVRYRSEAGFFSIDRDLDFDSHVLGFSHESGRAYYSRYDLKGGSSFRREWLDLAQEDRVFFTKVSPPVFFIIFVFISSIVFSLWLWSVVGLILVFLLMAILVFLLRGYFKATRLDRDAVVLFIEEKIFFIKKRNEIPIVEVADISVLKRSGRPFLSRVTVPEHYVISIQANDRAYELPAEYTKEEALESLRRLKLWLALD